MRKRAILVAALAAIMMLTMVSMASAVATSGYAVWSAGSAANLGTAATPHSDYRTTTVKCAVCHAVHKANPAGELLLDGDAGTSCLYCHVDGATGLVRIYAADRNIYTTTGAQYAHTQNGSGAAVGSRCGDCHAVHGAGAYMDSSVSKYILKMSTGATGAPTGVALPQATALAEANASDGAADEKQARIDAFCSMCHPYAQYSYNGTISVESYRASGAYQSGTFQSHVMTIATDTYGNPEKSIAATRVAWIGADHCRSCHDAGQTDVQVSGAVAAPYAGTLVTNSYPHYTPNYTRFLMSAEASSATPFGTTTYVPPSAPATYSTATDGVCLKCHRTVSGGTTLGIGYTF